MEYYYYRSPEKRTLAGDDESAVNCNEVNLGDVEHSSDDDGQSTDNTSDVEQSTDGDEQSTDNTSDVEQSTDEDEHSVDDDQSIINDDLFDIFITTFARKTICLEVKGSDTIGNVKVKLQTKAGIPHDEQALIFDEWVLEDGDTLDSFRINKDSTLTLVRKSMKKLKIFVKTLKGMVHSLEVKPSDTIGKVKNMIPPGFFSDDSMLIFNEMILDESRTVDDFHIIDNSTLTLMPESEGWMQLFVKILTGETIPVTVNPTYTIRNVKDRIRSQVNIPSEKQVLIFNEMVLEDSGTIVDFQINPKSTLTLLCRSSGLMQIFVKINSGKTLVLEVKLSDTINDVKAKIKEKVVFPEGHTRIMVNGSQLNDYSLTLADCHIQKDSTLRLRF